MTTLRLGTLISDPVSNKAVPSSSYIALDLLFHISSFSKVLAAADVLDIVGSPFEKAAFTELKSLILLMINSNQHDLIDIQPFLDKLSAWTSVDYCKIDQNDVLCVWDDIVKLIMVVIPPLREVFLGQVSSALEVPGWVNLMSRCFHADFTESVSTLEEVYLSSLTSVPSTPASAPKAPTASSDNGPEQQPGAVVSSAATAMDKLRIANAMVLRRAPEILVVSIESSHILQVCPSPTHSYKGPQAIRFPETFDLAHFSPSNGSSNSNANPHSQEMSKIYDLSIVVALEGPNLDTLQPYFRITGEKLQEHWYKGAGFAFEEVSKCRVIEGNFYSSVSEMQVHPRLLVYTRRDLPLVLDRTLHLVSKAGQMRALGDVAFALAMTTCENYGEARRCYEEAISLDEGLRVALQENLSSLEKIERTQRARVLEEQADLALANKRFREASELYSKGMMNAVVSSGVYLRVRDKLESVTHIIALDSACQFAEKGEEALKLGLLPNAKDLYSQAFKLNPEFLHLHTILVGIDKTLQMLTAGQRIADAQTAAKAYHYKLANHFYREAIALVPEKLAGLQSTLDSLAPLMQGEDALMRQKLGLTALEDKRYAAAIQLFTEAIGLLPQTQASCLEHAVFLCDRALAHYDLKDFNTAVKDCTAALGLKPELAIAHFRLGAAQFGLDQFDLASSSYERALKCDPSLSESIKVKVRQVTTAREIQQRKEREAERAKAKEEERKSLEEKRARDELLKKERAEKLSIEQAEKAERNRVKEEERRAKAAKDKELEKEKEKEKEAEKEKFRIEKAERDALKAFERERARIEKEKERERVRIEKEQKAISSRKIQEEEKQRQIDFIADLERGAARQREAEKEKEAERERARLERERVIAEREKARKEKLDLEASKLAAESLRPTPVSSVSPLMQPPLEGDGLLIPRGEAKGEVVSAKGGAQGKKNSAATATSSSGSLRWSAVAVPGSRSGVLANLPDDDSKNISNISTNGGNAAANGASKAAAGKVWTASKHSADTITRIPSAVPGSSSSPVKLKGAPPSTDSLADFPKLGESMPQAPKSNGESEILDPDSSTAPSMFSKEDNGQELGWSVRKTSPQKSREPSAASSSSFSSSQLSSSNDIFSSMAERPAMSTDYTFKPSERTIKAAEAKRLADSQQKAAAAAAAASCLSGNVKGDFDEFLSNSSASYISNFSSSIRFNPALSVDIAPSNGLFFSVPSPLGPGSQSRISSSSNFQDTGGLTSTFSNSFSGLGFSSSFLSSSGTPTSALSAGGTASAGSLGLGLGGIGIGGSDGLNGISLSDECDDDFSGGYFNNPLSSLGGLDLDDATDPLLMAIGGLSMSPSDSPTASHLSPSGTVPSSPIRQLGILSRQDSPRHSQVTVSAQGYSPTNFPAPLNGGLYSSGNGGSQNFGYPSNTASPSSSSSFSPRLDPLPSPFQRSFSGDLGPNTGPGQGLNGLAFPTMGSFGGLRVSNSNGNIADAFASGDNDFYAAHAQNRGVGIAMANQYGGIQQQQQQQLQLQQQQLQQQMFSPFQQPKIVPIAGGIGGVGDRSPQHSHTQSLRPAYSGPLPPPIPLPTLPQPFSPALSMSHPTQGQDGGHEGIESDILPESAFTSVAWLRQHGMHMYRWAGDAAEWTEYAMHLPPNVSPFFSFDPSSSAFPSLLSELQCSGCKMWIDKETLMGREATFLVFLRGAAGQPSNISMNSALDLLSNKMRQLLPQISTLSFGSIGSNRVSTPPPPPSLLNPVSLTVAVPMRPPHSAWGAGTSFSSIGAESTPSAGFVGEDEDHSTISDEYYDPEALAISLSLLGEGTEGPGTETDWSTVPARRNPGSSTRRPEPLKLSSAEGQGGGYVQRWLEIPRDSVGLVIGQGGKKIKDLCTMSGAKVQFRVNKTAEREGRPGLLELQGGVENVDQGLQLVWDLLHVLGKEYQEVPVQRLK